MKVIHQRPYGLKTLCFSKVFLQGFYSFFVVHRGIFIEREFSIHIPARPYAHINPDIYFDSQSDIQANNLLRLTAQGNSLNIVLSGLTQADFKEKLIISGVICEKDDCESFSLEIDASIEEKGRFYFLIWEGIGARYIVSVVR